MLHTVLFVTITGYIFQESGNDILEALNSNITIRELDLRMCQIPSETELQIQEIMEQNRKQKRTVQRYLPLHEINEPLEENNELLNKLNSVWEQDQIVS